MLLTINNLNLTYRNNSEDLRILHNINLTIDRGQTVSLKGVSGAGKTSLLMIMAGLLRPSSGQIIIDNTDFTQLNEQELALARRGRIGIVFQQFHLMPHLTALENVMLPLLIEKNSQASEQSRQMLQKVGLGNRTDHYPSMLSGGEQQRVALARAFVCEPKLILADEPTGNLDEKTGEDISQLMIDLVKQFQASLLVVTHSNILAKKMQYHYTLHQGHLSSS